MRSFRREVFARAFLTFHTRASLNKSQRNKSEERPLSVAWIRRSYF